MKEVERHRWTREAYDQMAEADIFAPGERVELIDGEIFTVSAQGTGHATDSIAGKSFPATAKPE